MLRVMLQKIWHKKWMVCCMLLGSILLIATIVSFPLYRSAAFDRMLQDEFEASLTDNGIWPARNEMTIISKKDTGGKTISRMEELMKTLYSQMGVEEKYTVLFYSLAKAEASSLMNRADMEGVSIRLGYMSDSLEHMTLLSGQAFSESGMADEETYEVMVSDACMVKQNLLLGETLVFDALKDPNGKKIQVKIVGVYEEDQEKDFYWQVEPESMTDTFLMKDEVFRASFLGENAGKYTLTCSYYISFQYENLKDTQTRQLIDATDYLTDESAYKSTVSRPQYRDILAEYESKRDRIKTTLFILQVPVLILLCAFLFMISGQMYDMERNEISVLKSRGSSGRQIFLLYFYQSLSLTALGTFFGIPLGMVFCRILGSAENFLEFSTRRVLNVAFDQEALLFLVLGILLSVTIMTIPAVRHSRVTIVKLKQQKAIGRKSWWEKCFIDIILLGISLYGYFSYAKNEQTMVSDVLLGKSLDPLLYISSSLFIVGLGLLLLRLQPYLVRLIFLIGRRHWKSASYASFLDNLKNGRKQQFIMLFMILTISLGMFHATVARTILSNAEDNTNYLDGTDVIIKEVWGDNSAFLANDSSISFQYFEPDFNKYATLGPARSYTKVIYDNKAYIAGGSNSRISITLMGIQTKQFGENTYMDDTILEKPYYEYLNELAVAEKGILVSRNFATVLNYKIGDSITYYDQNKGQSTGKIVDFVDYFPGYEPVNVTVNADGTVTSAENYLVVTHYALLLQNLGNVPYEVWITLKEDANSTEIAAWIGENNLKISKYVNRQEDLERTIEDPLLQGTNGVLTMGFIVTIILCGVGYLIYWIMSIRSREMLFGVLRACGMHKGELFHMLINEQVFSGAFSVASGIGIGKLVSYMFVPMLQTAYAASNQVLPMRLITNAADMVRLYGVVISVMAICLGVLILLVFKLNVAKALKLGEE